MLSQYLDISQDLLDNNEAIIDLSNYDYCVLQIAGNTGASYNYFSTIDSGAIQGVSDGSAVSSINFTSTLSTNLSNNSIENSNSGTDGLWKFNVIGRYLKIKFSSGTPNGIKALIMLAKIS